jgi:hypothetical protein
VIEVRVTGLRQFFDSIDPSPFRERDLDSKVEAFITEWAREVPRHMPLSLRVCINDPSTPDVDDGVVRDAVHQHFARRATSTRLKLRQLLRVGRVSLVVGLVVLAGSTGLSELVARQMDGGFGEILRAGLAIGGWVVMWRPLEIFLYDWWPIRGEARLYDRMSTMPVAVEWGSEAKR